MPSIFAYPHRLFTPFRRKADMPIRHQPPAMLNRLRKGRTALDVDTLTQRIILPSLAVADEDLARLSLWETGRAMARQDNWDELAQMIISADDARLTTPGGVDEASLLAQGAQSDVVAAHAEALQDGAPPDPAAIASFEEILNEVPDNHAIALVVALAHLNIGRAWLAAPDTTTPQHHRHFKRATALLVPLDAEELDAPSVAAAQCALAEIMSPESDSVIEAYQRLLPLDAHNAVHLRAFGRALVHTLADDPQKLEQQARDMAERTQCIWGQGAYVWIYLDALAQSRDAMKTVDTSVFVRGLRDILERKPDQHVTNELAAFCAIAMAPTEAALPRDLARTKGILHENLDWILSDHLQELHPMVWSQTPRDPVGAPRQAAQRALVAQGRKTALRVIARRFADQLSDGSTIAFSPAGMYRLPAM